ncbi:EcsC protein family [Gottschalkia purinilytica]|uniref:EcsC protein family n=1 Tax=Gottschalkia purinilytica TaxID=1503 RepID=A0A0L0WF77_GOTPU|nr:EcsC family protein [Gottschalkia purinilytica]KNF10086.1 EcsC protein family [Gottschalkia purinilytica]
MTRYEEQALRELNIWKQKMSKKPSITNRITKGIQKKMNNIIPEKAHRIITEAIKNMTKAVLTGSKYITRKPLVVASLEKRENLVKESLNFYKKAASVSGAGTGAGGILIGLADFPILLSLKMKFLFNLASLYGFDVKDYRERIYILYVFELAFSSQEKRNEVYHKIENWNNYVKTLPENIDMFDWRDFQQEYRDYIDLAKMLQLVPGIGSIVGAYTNYQLMEKLGEIAMNAYRLRVLKCL